MAQTLNSSITLQLATRVETVERDLATVRTDLGHLRTELSHGMSEIRDLFSRAEQGKEKSTNTMFKFVSVSTGAVMAILGGLVWLVNSMVGPVNSEAIRLSSSLAIHQAEQSEFINQLSVLRSRIEGLDNFVDRWYNEFKIPERFTRVETLIEKLKETREKELLK